MREGETVGHARSEYCVGIVLWVAGLVRGITGYLTNMRRRRLSSPGCLIAEVQETEGRLRGTEAVVVVVEVEVRVCD